MLRARAITAAAGLALAGCGSADLAPPAAEPGLAPAPTTAPAGRVVEIGNEPEGLAADPRTGLVAVGLRNPDRLALVDGASGRVVRRVTLPESPRHLQLAGPGGPVLAPAERTDQLLAVTLPAGRVTATQSQEFPHDAAAVDGILAVGNELGDTLSLIDPSGASRTVPTARQPGGLAALDGGRLAVVAVRDRVIELFDVADGERIAVEDAGVGPTHVVADGSRLYVADTQGDAVLVFDTEPELRINDRLALPGAPYGIAIDRRRGRLWVTLSERNRLVELELQQRAPRRLRSFPTVHQPNTVAVDERSGRVFVAGRRDGRLQILDPER